MGTSIKNRTTHGSFLQTGRIMGYRIEQNERGKWEWEFFMSSHGWIGGECDTEAEAITELIIGEELVMETPFSPVVIEMLREDPERTARGIVLDCSKMMRKDRDGNFFTSY